MAGPEKYLLHSKCEFRDCSQALNYVYEKETGNELGLPSRTESLRKNAKIAEEKRSAFEEIAVPEELCLALIALKRSKFLHPTHVALVFKIDSKYYYLHFTDKLGFQLHTEHQLEQRGMTVSGYFRRWT